MANNRLYLIDAETGEKCLFAKGWGRGWVLNDPDQIREFLKDRDIASSGAPDVSSNLKLEIE